MDPEWLLDAERKYRITTGPTGYRIDDKRQWILRTFEPDISRWTLSVIQHWQDDHV